MRAIDVIAQELRVAPLQTRGRGVIAEGIVSALDLAGFAILPEHATDVMISAGNRADPATVNADVIYAAMRSAYTEEQAGKR